MNLVNYHPYLGHRELAETAVQEEMAEVAIELTKARRFGWNDVCKVKNSSAAQRAAIEIGDLLGSLDFLLATHPEIDQELVSKTRATRIDRLVQTNDMSQREPG